jgi:murein DD-endopeptidase MepM/ murein hydrolase activator NlpD
MSCFRVFIGLFSALTLAACASAPQRHSQQLHIPERTQPVRSESVLPPLRVCPGMQVSNAPVADSNLMLVGYQPYSRVGRVKLARAPVVSCVSSGFGPRSGGASSFHRGVDLYTRGPAPVYAGGDGVVTAATSMRGYGNVIFIRHGDGVETRYAHLSEFAPGLRPGVRVRSGDYIGRTGRTGNATAVHLHYEVLIDGRRQNPLTIGG